LRDGRRRQAEPSEVPGFDGSTSGYTTADCPPPTSDEAASRSFESGAKDRTQDAAVPLVGIARLAASSPTAQSKRKSLERPE